MSSFTKFLAENKAWWITPIVVVLALIVYLLATGGDGAQGETPFVYDLH